MTTELQCEANRRNSLKSTGPRTAEGKKKSSANALKHGLCAIKLVNPFDDSEQRVAREDAWQAELNPGGKEVEGYLVALAVRHSFQLDQIHIHCRAETAERVRRCKRRFVARRMHGVENATRLMEENCDTGHRLLMQTPQGCQFLIERRQNLKLPLTAVPMLWDYNDQISLMRWSGRHVNRYDFGTPSPQYIETKQIEVHRAVKFKLDRNKNPTFLPYMERYANDSQKQEDLDQFDALTAGSITARDTILQVLDDDIVHLTQLMRELEAEDEITLAELHLRAQVDDSDRGKLLHRYALDHERGLVRTLKELQIRDKAQSQSTQDDDMNDIMEIQPSPAPVSKPASSDRNEASLKGVSDPRISPERASNPSYSSVRVCATPPDRHKNQQ